MADPEAVTAGRYPVVVPARVIADPLWEDADDVIALAMACGYDAPRSRLRSWHRAGIVGPPRQVSAGVHGTRTLYPPGTATVFLESCELHRSERKLKNIAWALWWGGLTTPELAARVQLADFAGVMAGLLDQLVQGGQLTERAEQALDTAHRSRLPTPMARIRRRAGTENFGSVLQSLLFLAAGQVGQLGDGALEELSHAFGEDRARSDVLVSIGGPWVDGDRRVDMENISALASPVGFAATLKRATDADLDLAREEAKAFARGLADFGYALRKGVDNWAYGMAGWGWLFEDLIASPDFQRYMVLALLRCKESGLTPNLQTVLDAMAENQQMRANVDLVMELREVVPAVAAALPRGWLRTALSEPDGQERISKGIAQVREDHAEEIDQFLASKHKGAGGSAGVVDG